jgi:hypothetical protein
MRALSIPLKNGIYLPVDGQGDSGSASLKDIRFGSGLRLRTQGGITFLDSSLRWNGYNGFFLIISFFYSLPL